MKKAYVFLLGLLLLTGSVAFGLDLSAGAVLDYTSMDQHLGGTVSGSDVSQDYIIPALSFGAFFDATYVQVSVANDTSLQGTTKVDSGSSTTTTDFTDHLTSLSAELLGKYPFDLGIVKLFPLLGVAYDLNLTYTDKNGNDVKKTMTDQEQKDLNQLWFKVGAGADFALTKQFYIRPEVLFGYKLPTKTDSDMVDAAKASGVSDAGIRTTRWDIRILAGFSF